MLTYADSIFIYYKLLLINNIFINCKRKTGDNLGTDFKIIPIYISLKINFFLKFKMVAGEGLEPPTRGL